MSEAGPPWLPKLFSTFFTSWKNMCFQNIPFLLIFFTIFGRLKFFEAPKPET